MTWQIKLLIGAGIVAAGLGLQALVVHQAEKRGRQEVLLEIEIERNKNRTKADTAEAKVEDCYRRNGRWDRASQSCFLSP